MPASPSLLAVAACFRYRHSFKQHAEGEATSGKSKDAHRDADYL